MSEQLNNIEKKSAEIYNPPKDKIERPDDHESSIEASQDNIHESRIEAARSEAIETAISSETKSKNLEKTKNNTTSRRGTINKKQRNESYKRTMTQVQKDLTIPSKLFSKVIHNNIIEKASDTIGGTIARPNAILSGAFFAFLLTLSTYTIAKTIGYALSGFETIISFAIGWTVGIAYDYLRVIITGKK
jgi:hypothetical protein